MNKEQEGVIKYHLNHQDLPISKTIQLLEINSWRTILHHLQLIGQHSDRYNGLGFGNISQRINDKKYPSTAFIISGTQTGKFKQLSRQQYCVVTKANTVDNSIHSTGLCQPSSEALTHASVYQQHPNIHCVIHIHNVEIWQQTKHLALASTDAKIAYGTPDMANEIARLYSKQNNKTDGIFSMLGHEDGIIAYSSSMEIAANALISLYAQALSIKFSTM